MEQYELGCLKIKRDADQQSNAAAISKYKKDLGGASESARGYAQHERGRPEMAALQKMTLANMTSATRSERPHLEEAEEGCRQEEEPLDTQVQEEL